MCPFAMVVGPIRAVVGRACHLRMGGSHPAPYVLARSCCTPARSRPASCQAPRTWARPATAWQLGPLSSWPRAGAIGGTRAASSGPPGGDPDASDPYSVLGVAPGCTDKDVKKAYLRSAQAHHPDMNPDDAKAADRFRRVSMAYEALRSEEKRSAFDAGGASQQAWSSGTSNADTFEEASRDQEIILEALALYAEAVREEVGIAVSAAQRGDWKEVKEVAKEHSGLFAVLGALLLVLRFPMAVASAARFLVLVLFHPSVRQIVMRLAVDKQLWNFAWLRLMAAARRQRARLKDRKKDRDSKQPPQRDASSGSSAGGSASGGGARTSKNKANDPGSGSSGESNGAPKRPQGPRKR